MMTVRQIERNWSTRQYGRLLGELMAGRSESLLCLGMEPTRTVAAAMGIIRMDELYQSAAGLYPQLVRALLAAQEADGGWGELMTTALSVRALLCGHGGGLAIERGLAFLADMQKPEGIWPRVPIRRTPEDPYTSAFVLYQLGDQPIFRARVRLADALAWFELNQPYLDDRTSSLWDRARLRCPQQHAEAAGSWS